MSESESILIPAGRADRLEALLLTRRLRDFARGSWLASLPSACSILLIYAGFRDAVPGQFLTAWAAAGLALAFVRTFAVRPSTVDGMPLARMQAQWRVVNLALGLGAVVFAVIFPVIGFYARGPGLLALGVIATAVFTSTLLMHRTAPAAARFHIVLVGASLLVTTWFAAGPDGWPLAALIVLYGGTLLGAVHTQERTFLAAARAEVERADAEETVRVLLYEFEEQSADWLWSVDEAGRLRDVTPRFAALLGQTPDALEGRRLLALFRRDEAQRLLATHIAERNAFRDIVLQLRHGEERRFWRLSARPQADGGLRGVARDVTADRLTEERIAFMAHYDNLTGLANRYLFNERIAAMIGAEGGSGHVALFYLDLDDFKAVNDTRGHGLGDRLLREVGARLEQETREGDLVARLGGDEFAVLLESRGSEAALIERAGRFLDVIRAPFEIEEQRFRVSTCIGIARCVEGDCDSQELMRRADLALAAAKARGRDTLTLFEPAIDHAARERRELEADLREAVARGELRLHYQPVLDLDAAVTTGYEALLRWHHPRRGTMLPGEFLALAEETGLIVPIGQWVIREALAQSRHWAERARIAINLSPTQIDSPGLVPLVAQAIEEHDYPAEQIEFEITEHVLMQEGDAGYATLVRLRELGTSIALDDFGIGYSSLGYLRRFPFDRIKIDRNFVEDIETNADSQAIVSSITRLADALGMQTTAEGVERRGQLDMLRKLGCDEAQGNLICTPRPVDDLPVVDGEDLTGGGYSAAIIDYRRARAAVLARRGGSVA